MKIQRAGFTLMEIMVVIIVIAVLASVAGPMIGSITDQGRASATKSKMSALKSSLLTYNSDVGRFPFWGISNWAGCSSSHNGENSNNVLGDVLGCNVLSNGDVGCTSFGIKNYNRRWKGPYMESDPADFMYDSWGVKMDYLAHYDQYQIYLWSAGPDMGFHGDFSEAINADEYAAGNHDDLSLSISRRRTKFK